MDNSLLDMADGSGKGMQAKAWEMKLLAKGKAFLLRADRFIEKCPRHYVRGAIAALAFLLLYLDYITGPFIPLSVFYLLTLFIAIKYVDSRFAYLLVLLIATGKTYVRLYENLIDLTFGHWLWQFASLGTLYGLFCYLMDSQLSSRRRAEAELGDLRQLSRAIIDETDSGIMFFNPAGRCIIANQAAARILECPRERLLGSNYLEEGDGQFAVLLEAGREAVRNGGPHRITAKLAGEGEREVWCAVSAGVIHRAEGDYLLIVFADVSAYKAIEDARSQAELALSRAQAAERQLISIGEEVQQRLGRELHDDLGQRLMGAAFLSEVLFQKLRASGDEAMGEASRITAVLNETMDRTRKMAQGLYPAQLPERGLAGMLELFAEQVETMNGIRCEFVNEAAHHPNNPEIAIHIFRIVQEAVSNALRHGKAGRIVLRIREDAGMWKLDVDDDGCGLGKAGQVARESGIGLRSMRYRAELIGAVLHVGNRTEKGARVALRYPLEEQENHAA